MRPEAQCQPLATSAMSFGGQDLAISPKFPPTHCCVILVTSGPSVGLSSGPEPWPSHGDGAGWSRPGRSQALISPSLWNVKCPAWNAVPGGCTAPAIRQAAEEIKMGMKGEGTEGLVLGTPPLA